MSPDARPPTVRDDTVLQSVGLLCNCTLKSDPKEQLSPSQVNRAFLLDELLAPSGIQLFLYSPKDVTKTTTDVAGYTVKGRELVPAMQPIPRVNANWTYGTRRLINKGMGYKRFKRWAAENQIAIYVPYEFSELVSNKRKAYEVVREHDPSLHPHTEDFIGSAAQLESFLSRSEMVFIKPRAGNRGNRIFVLRRAGSECSLKYYEDGAQRLLSPVTLPAVLGVIDVAAGEKRYVIQEGVESLRYEGSVFDVRVVMLHDSKVWSSILEIRLAPRDSDLSNIFQGGSSQITDDLFGSMFGADEARALESEIRRVSHSLAEYLESLFPSELMELGFDFVLDRELGLHLVEVNAKPGMTGRGAEIKLFDWKAEDEAYYQKWVYPHIRPIADFLRSKLERV